MAQPPDRLLTTETQLQRVSDWLDNNYRPNGIHFLDIENKYLLGFMETLDRKTRSSLERTCKALLLLSRSAKPRLLQLSFHFTTTWNHDRFVELTAHFSQDHIFHAIFILKKRKNQEWLTGGWSTERAKKINSGTFPTEKIRPASSFVERTSRYMEYWMRNFEIDVLKIREENLIPGKEDSIQQMNYIGPVPQLKLKKFILHGANNIRFILHFLNALSPNNINSSRRTIDVDLINVAKLDQIFFHHMLTGGNVKLNFHRVNTHFTRKTLNFVNSPTMSIVARQVPSETVNVFLKRWSRGEIIEDFEFLHITETTQWESQRIKMDDVIRGIRTQPVKVTTELDLKILRIPPIENQEEPPQIYRVFGPRVAFCVHSNGQFIFEAPPIENIPRITVDPPIVPSISDHYDRQKNRIYMALFRQRLIRLFN